MGTSARAHSIKGPAIWAKLILSLEKNRQAACTAANGCAIEGGG
jgi:hypothetical protein